MKKQLWLVAASVWKSRKTKLPMQCVAICRTPGLSDVDHFVDFNGKILGTIWNYKLRPTLFSVVVEDEG